MANGFHFQNVGLNLSGGIQKTPSDIGFGSMPKMDINSLDDTPKASFKDVMGGLSNGLNNEVNKPDQLLKRVMSGDDSVDIHDVMIAMANAEMSISVATQVTSKVIQAYDKITQISV